MSNICIWQLSVIHKVGLRPGPANLCWSSYSSIIYHLKTQIWNSDIYFQSKKTEDKRLPIIPCHTSGTKISNLFVIQMRHKSTWTGKCSIVSDFNFWLQFKFLLIKHKTYISYSYKEFILNIAIGKKRLQKLCTLFIEIVRMGN